MSGGEPFAAIARESDLYGPTRRFVAMRLPGLISRRARSGAPVLFCNEVADAVGDPSGRWSRPDVAVLAIARGEYVPYWRADLHSIEVKTAGNVDVIGAHEARAHGRFAHYAWLAFQAVGRAAPDTSRYREIVDSAAGLGVGVFTCTDADDPDAWQVVEWPEHTGAEDAVADAFVRQRFNDDTKRDIRTFLSKLGWPTPAED